MRGNTAEVRLLARDRDNVQAVTAALKQVHVTDPTSVAAVITFLEKRLPDKHASSTMSLKSKGGKEILQARTFNGMLYLRAPLPAHLLFGQALLPLEVPHRKYLTVRNKALLVQNSNILIKLLQDVLDYKPRRGDNRPPPDLWLDDNAYLEDLRQLVAELKRLNDLLEKRVPKTASTMASIDLKQSAQKFVDSYADESGKRGSQITFAVVVGLVGMTLYLAGFSPEAISKLYAACK